MTRVTLLMLVYFSLGLAYLVIPSLAGDHPEILLYEDLGCTPVQAAGKNCPTTYKCVGLGKWTDKCYFKGKAYEDGESLNDSLIGPSCRAACFCDTQGPSARFICAIVDCAEFFGITPPPGCYFTYDLTSCCSSGQICGPPTAPSFPEDLAKCTVDGKEYKEGQKFTPNNANCMDCVCLKNFTGQFKEPFCKRRSCGLQLQGLQTDSLNKFCGPIYDKDERKQCCPSNWVCPSECGSEQFQGVGTCDETCQYGERTLKVGQFFEKQNVQPLYGPEIAKVKCECIIPPLVSCTEV